jgi:peptidoglycan/LPS O-acetylase OafA/YrhL
VVEGASQRADDPGAAIAHVPALDGVRGIAIALVLALHFGVAADLPLRSSNAVARWLERLFYVGWTGVDLFFVLSGFLITSILLASRDGPRYFRTFYGRRVLRIFPLYYTALILGLVVLPALASPERSWGLLQEPASGHIWLWTYTLNIGLAFGVIAHPIASLSHFWTLAIEEQYYLAWPWLVKVMSGRRLLALCGLLVLVALVMRIAWVALGFDPQGAYRFTLTRADSLAIGGAVAILMRDKVWRDRLLELAPAGTIVALGIVALIFSSVPRFYPTDRIVVTLGHSAIALASAGLILLALRPGSSKLFSGRALRSLGKYSYGIYVWHFPLQRMLLAWYWTRPAQPSSSALVDAAVFVTAGLAGSILLGWISYYAIERPFLRLKRLFVYSKTDSRTSRTSADPVLAPSVR